MLECVSTHTSPVPSLSKNIGVHAQSHAASQRHDAVPRTPKCLLPPGTTRARPSRARSNVPSPTPSQHSIASRSTLLQAVEWRGEGGGLSLAGGMEGRLALSKPACLIILATAFKEPSRPSCPSRSGTSSCRGYGGETPSVPCKPACSEADNF